MTKQEQNDIIKRVWTDKLRRKDDIPKTLADNYSIWLRSIIKQASSQLSTEQPAEQQGAEQPSEQQETA